jgi:hypothetical protein
VAASAGPRPPRSRAPAEAAETGKTTGISNEAGALPGEGAEVAARFSAGGAQRAAAYGFDGTSFHPSVVTSSALFPRYWS